MTYKTRNMQDEKTKQVQSFGVSLTSEVDARSLTDTVEVKDGQYERTRQNHGQPFHFIRAFSGTPSTYKRK